MVEKKRCCGGCEDGDRINLVVVMMVVEVMVLWWLLVDLDGDWGLMMSGDWFMLLTLLLKVHCL